MYFSVQDINDMSSVLRVGLNQGKPFVSHTGNKTFSSPICFPLVERVEKKEEEEEEEDKTPFRLQVLLQLSRERIDLFLDVHVFSAGSSQIFYCMLFCWIIYQVRL